MFHMEIALKIMMFAGFVTIAGIFLGSYFGLFIKADASHEARRRDRHDQRLKKYLINSENNRIKFTIHHKMYGYNHYMMNLILDSVYKIMYDEARK